MRNCLVLGSGRSGTSMVTGALANAGYHLGESLHAPRAANPKGFFESAEINDLNDAMLGAVLPEGTDLSKGQRWLGVPVEGAVVAPTPDQERRIAAAVARAPFCYKDPRFSFTLPAWREAIEAAPGGTGLVCVFRHPAATATSMVAEVASAPYLAGVAFDLGRAFELWIETYREILDRHADRGDSLFLHYDQVLHGDGLDRLGAFLGADVDAAFPDGMLRREPPKVEVPQAALEIYAELCRRAEFADAAAPSRALPRVTAIVPVEKGREHLAAAAVANAKAQRGVSVDVIVLDRTGGRVELDGASTVPSTSVSFGADLVRAVEAAEADVVAIELPGAPSLPSRYAHAVAKLSGDVDVVTCDYALTDANGAFVQRSSPAAMGDTPGPFWFAGVVAKRSKLADVPTTAFHPVLLAWWRAVVHARGASHEQELGFTVPAEAYAAGWERSRSDARLVALASRPYDGLEPRLTVSICTYQRRDVLVRCLDAFCRQELPPGTFEIVLVDDGSTDGTEEMLGGLEFPVPVTVVRRENGGLAAARNSGLEVSRGEYVLFVNDDTIPLPNCVEEHLGAHRAAGLVGRSAVAVLGTFEFPVEAQRNALVRALERSNLMVGYVDLEPGGTYDCFKFWTCNVSVSLDLVRRAGLFDESFRHYGCEDTDLGARLERFGVQVLYHPRARAEHVHPMDHDYVERRAHIVARAYVRLVKKHPHLLRRWNNHTLRLEDLEWAIENARSANVGHARVARELSRVDLRGLETMGGEHARTAELVVERLLSHLQELNRTWWFEGFVEGIAEQGAGDFVQLARDAQEPERVRVGDRRSSPTRRNAPTPDVSVVVPTRDRGSELVNLVAALAKQDLDPLRFEVIVVDDGSVEPVDRAKLHAPSHLSLRVLRQDPAARPRRATSAWRTRAARSSCS
ncbi:MAG: glycosyltransferase [Planctomycetota bacterium]